jgi:biopolymer transport protein ExbB/TolQ
MKRSPLGKFSLIFAGVTTILFVVHFSNVMPVLNTVIAPMLSLFGTLLGLMGYFERDKQRTPALLGMILNLVFLATWIILLVQSIS